jgi:hypothetical protein
MGWFHRIFSGNHMWGFREKPVVHVVVSKDPDPLPLNLISPDTRSLGTPTEYPVPPKPESFNYSKKIAEDVMSRLPSGVDKKRLLIKVQ